MVTKLETMCSAYFVPGDCSTYGEHQQRSIHGSAGSSYKPCSGQSAYSLQLASPQDQLKWQAHKVDDWHGLCDGTLEDM